MLNGPALIDGSSSPVTGRRFAPGGVSAAGTGQSATPCDVQLRLTARADQVVLARQVITCLAQATGFTNARIDDIRLAVTEACTNVVRHAYDGAPGRLEVDACLRADALEVSVADHGCGLRPRIDDGAGGLGLPLMAAIATSVEFGETGGRGTTVRLSFTRAE